MPRCWKGSNAIHENVDLPKILELRKHNQSADLQEMPSGPNVWS
jgi:hypothetical protein